MGACERASLPVDPTSSNDPKPLLLKGHALYQRQVSGMKVSLVCSVVTQWHVVRVTVAIYNQHTFQFVALTVSSSLFTRRVLQNVTIAMVTMGTIDSDCSQK